MSSAYFPPTEAELSEAEGLRSRMNVGRLLVRWRMKFGLTQKQLAERAGTKQSRISEVETLGGNVRFDTLDRIARALDLEITLQPRVGHALQLHTSSSPAEWTTSHPSAEIVSPGVKFVARTVTTFVTNARS